MTFCDACVIASRVDLCLGCGKNIDAMSFDAFCCSYCISLSCAKCGNSDCSKVLNQCDDCVIPAVTNREIALENCEICGEKFVS